MKKSWLIVTLLASACASPTSPTSVTPTASSPVVTVPTVSPVAAPTPLPAPPSISPVPVTAPCLDPRGRLFESLSADGKMLTVRNDGNCDYPIVFLSYNVISYSDWANGQIRIEVMETTLKPSVLQTLTLTKPLTGCYQTDFLYQMTAADVAAGRDKLYPPYDSRLILVHGQMPVGCDPPHYDPPQPPNPPDPPACPTGQHLELHDGPPACYPNDPPPPPPPGCVEVTGKNRTMFAPGPPLPPSCP